MTTSADKLREAKATVTLETLDGLIAGLRPEEWEWGPIGDNTLAYCNWAQGVAKVTDRPYEDVFSEYRERVGDGWRAKFAEQEPTPS